MIHHNLKLKTKKYVCDLISKLKVSNTNHYVVCHNGFFCFFILSLCRLPMKILKIFRCFLLVVLNAAFTQPQAQSLGCTGLGKGNVLNFSTLKVWEKL